MPYSVWQIFVLEYSSASRSTVNMLFFFVQFSSLYRLFVDEVGNYSQVSQKRRNVFAGYLVGLVGGVCQ